MKKIIFSASLFLMVCMAGFAQDNEMQASSNSDGKAILPEAGDIAIGIEAGPFLRYFGNFFNDTQNNLDPSLLFKNGQTLYGKYFLSNTMAVRASLGFSGSKSVDRRYVRNDLAFFNDPLSREQVVDRRSIVSSDYLIGLGVELRRGYNRLQGFYGAELQFGWEKTKYYYSYGNPFSDVFPSPSTYDFSGNLLSPTDRVLDYNYGSTFSTGVNAFIGVEYFILPKLSIGGECGLGIAYQTKGVEKYNYEHWNGTTTEEMLQLVSPGDRDFSAFVVNPKGGIFVMFHF